MAIAHPPYKADSPTNWELEITQLVNLNDDKLTNSSIKINKLIIAITEAVDFADLQERVKNI